MSSRDVLVVADVQRDVLDDTTLELLSVGRGLAAAAEGQLMCVVLSADGQPFAESLSAADRLLLVNDVQLTVYSPGPYVTALQEVIAAEQPGVILVGGTSIGWDIAPLLACRLQAPLLTGCLAVQRQGDGLSASVSFCAGKMMADVHIAKLPAFLMVMPGSSRATDEVGRARVEIRVPSAPLAAEQIRFQEWVLPEPGDVDITQQSILVAVGRGIQQEDNVELAEELARVLHGAVCASRPVVDQGWLPATRQVGKSGMTVKPKLYLALGISGAPEHVEGMKGAGLIIAVNTDPNAPIFDVAHYGAEIDALDLLPALVEAVSAKKV